MDISIPLYIEERKVSGSPHSQFTLRPLFFTSPAATNQHLSGGMSKLAQRMRESLDLMAKEPRQDQLMMWTFSPPMMEHALKFTIELRRSTAEGRFIAATFEALDRRVAYVPALNLYFEITRGQKLEARAKEVITHHFRQLEKDEADYEFPKELTDYKRAWTSVLELDIQPNPKLPKAGVEGLLAIFSGEKMDGRAELHKVGRCLDWLYPDDLDRVILRDEEVDELLHTLSAKERRPVLLLGPRKSGKTAVIHEVVQRRVQERGKLHKLIENVWLLSPPRLISGMSYVGQWESRVLAIFEEAKKNDHVLYFDDVLGLYHAGVSADSDLNVAAVMRPWLERRDFRMLAEMTSEALRVLQERDRGLADLFHVIPVREMNEGQTRRVLMHVIRQLENQHRCEFGSEVTPITLDLQQRYVRDQALPGKAAGFVAQLALKFRQREIARADALNEFQAKSGLSVSFLDTNTKLARKDVAGELSKRIIGQPGAIDAVADVVTIAKARLNDPTRPLGTFLFLGPTGVGKTQCAKALAAYLFGAEERLLRFDMNEYLDPASVARLVGTFTQPEGLLTSTVRRQPYCVLLLDEIEKAHPDAFDVLLQVLGEGRLTDALGRTSDFTNAIIIMTSNLGSQKAGTTFGLKPKDAKKDEVYLDAAERFFRPEFFNRIDRVVPFNKLSREHIGAIANQIIGQLFSRQGLVHRRVVLSVDPGAMSSIIDQGYHPDLGARALKRAIEKQLTQPIAARLAALAPDAPMLVSIYGGKQGVTPHMQPIVYAKPVDAKLDVADTEAALTRVEEYLNHVETKFAAMGQSGKTVSTDALSPAHFRYFAIREQIRKMDRIIQGIDNQGGKPSRLHRPRVKPPKRVRWLSRPHRNFESLAAANDINVHLAELMERSTAIGDETPDRVRDLLHEAALLGAMSRDDFPADRALLHFRNVSGHRCDLVAVVVAAYQKLFARQFGFVATRMEWPVEHDFVLLLEMPAIEAIVGGEIGTHVFYPHTGNIVPMQVLMLPLAGDADAEAALKAHWTARNAWREKLTKGEATPGDDPHPLAPVIRVYDPNAATLDLRTGLLCPDLPTAEDLRRFVMAGLPLPLMSS